MRPLHSFMPARNARYFARLLLLLVIVVWSTSAAAAPVSVRYSEGIVRGFLVLQSTDGALVASGDFLQVKQENGEVETRTVFYFKDGSLFDETVRFTQKNSFTMQSYRLVHKGPAFKQDMSATLERASGKYRVVVKPHGKAEKVYEGKFDFPSDLYNGMIPIIAKNLREGGGESVHLVAFTPAPRVIGLDLVPSGKNKVMVGAIEKSVLHYVLKPKLGVGLKIPAALLGRLPPDNHLWVMTSEVPAFVRFEGPLYPEGPVWQIELTSPRWVK
ncbi:hypothetical protein LPW11_21070 [Geomonas sp. RF6]|uniref:hypothetical protein n=1 Tax=Geomonas sp. RF6 TaxID=2897342 RepID=UPI001E33582A|nr:hypothetical protein [Geomonas sp. RF6]UFS70348.1 hypothetical protein LPW11_21070 [Geomonas sp. RF6]